MFYIIKMFSVRTELQISDDFILETTFPPSSMEALEETHLGSKVERYGPWWG